MKYIVNTPNAPAWFWVTKRDVNMEAVPTTMKLIEIWAITTLYTRV